MQLDRREGARMWSCHSNIMGGKWNCMGWVIFFSIPLISKSTNIMNKYSLRRILNQCKLGESRSYFIQWQQSLISEVGNSTSLARQELSDVRQNKACTQGQKDLLSGLAFLKSTEWDIKAAHLGILNLKMSLTSWTCSKNTIPSDTIRSSGNTWEKTHLFWLFIL